MNKEQVIEMARAAGIKTDLVDMGAASCVFSEGCHGVALTDFERFAQLADDHAPEGSAKSSDESHLIGYGYVVRTAYGKEFLALQTIRSSRTKAKRALNGFNEGLAQSGKPILEAVELKRVQIQTEATA